MATEKPTQTVPEEQVSSTAGTQESAAMENTTENLMAGEAVNDTPAAGMATEAGVVVTGDVSDNSEAADETSAEDAEPAGEADNGSPAEDIVEDAGSDVAEPAVTEVETTSETAEEEGAEEYTEDAVAEEVAEVEAVGEEAPEQEPVSGDTVVAENIIEVQDTETTKAEEPEAEEAAAGDVISEEEITQPASETTEAETVSAEPATEVAETVLSEAPGLEQATDIAAPVSEEPATIIEGTPAIQATEDAEAVEKVDFSEEEAELDKLAAEKPEFDLGEKEESELAHESVSGVEAFDTAGKSKSQLLDIFAVLLADRPVQTIRREVEAIKVAFYRLLRAQQEELRHKFIEEGGEPEDFAPPVDNDEERLKDLFSEYRKRRDDFISQLDRSKEENLKIKLKVIEDLKELVNSSETLGNTFSAFRELQQRWRDAGPVPQANVKDLWETYNHHVENFYSYIKINKELRDLDLRKNYEAKIALCEEAEALLLEPSVINSFHRLQKLHEQWRETGPVANEYKESLWERFREASSRINKQHQEYFDGQKEEQKRNLDLKTELCVKTEELAAGVWTTRKEWNKASDKLLEIQKVWKTIGFAPKKDNAKIYERFRNACDKFFEQKRMFYQQIKLEMELNLQLKNEICEAAEAVQDSEEWKKTTDELIALQKKWKEIGPVARRHSDAVWKRFRAACDHFFGRKSGHFASKDAEQDVNLRMKRELLAEIAAADIQAGGFEMIKDFQRRWSEIGFVPIKQKDSIQKEYKAAMDQAFSILRGSGQAMQMDRFRDKVRNMKTSGDKRLRFERDRLYNKVKQLESEIALLENNIGFFANSKNAESMIRDVKDKIEKTRAEMAAAIEKINLIDNQEE